MRRPVAATALTIAIAFGSAGELGAGVDPASAASCRTQSSSVSVALDKSKYPGTTDHVHDAVAAGQPSLLHIDRADADLHRDQSLRGIPTKSGYDRDEYPPAASREGGTGADVRYVVSSDNRGAGSTMGNQLEPYCEGQSFRITLVP